MDAVYFNAVQLGVWWSVWTLADTYLVRYTPVSEMLVFALCVCLYVAPDAVSRVRLFARRGREKLNGTLDRI